MESCQNFFEIIRQLVSWAGLSHT